MALKLKNTAIEAIRVALSDTATEKGGTDV
jgi:hypothetical protein